MNQEGRVPRHRWLLSVLASVLALWPGACGPSTETHVPVRGTVRLGDKLVTDGLVTFYPDQAKGNQRITPFEAELDKDGSYQVRADNQQGIPLGWYKVVVKAPKPPRNQEVLRDPKTQMVIFPDPPVWIINSKYTEPRTTPLSVEVVQDPPSGAYDFSVTK
ncbi:MAG TPA: hypothetical protein VH682_28745 [Gemmataceae bacterium]